MTSLLSMSRQICLTEPIWHCIHSSVYGIAITCQTLKSSGNSEQAVLDSHYTCFVPSFSSRQAHQGFFQFFLCQLNVV